MQHIPTHFSNWKIQGQGLKADGPCYLTSAPCTFKTLQIQSSFSLELKKTTILFFFLVLQLAYGFKIQARQIRRFLRTQINIYVCYKQSQAKIHNRNTAFSICMDPGDGFW